MARQMDIPQDGHNIHHNNHNILGRLAAFSKRGELHPSIQSRYRLDVTIIREGGVRVLPNLVT